MDISSDGGTLLISSVNADNTGAFTSEAMLIRTGESSAREEISISGALVYDCRFFDDGSFVLLTDKAMRFYNSRGEYKESYRYGYGFPDHFFISGDSIVFAYEGKDTERKCTIVSYSSDGEHLMTREIEGAYRDMCATSHEAFVLLDTGVFRVSLKTGKVKYFSAEEYPYIKGKEGIIMGAAEDIYVTGKNAAVRLDR